MYIERTSNAGEPERFALQDLTEEDMAVVRAALYAFIERAEAIRPEDDTTPVRDMIRMIEKSPLA